MDGYIKKDEKTGGMYFEDIRKFTLSYKESLGYLSKYFEGLEKGIVYASKCKKCGYKFYPPRNVCPKCGSRDIEWFIPSRRGKLLTFAEMNVKPITHSHYDDYIVGIGEFDDVKIVGLVDGEYESLSIDMDIEWSVTKRQPENYLVIILKPVKK